MSKRSKIGCIAAVMAMFLAVGCSRSGDVVGQQDAASAADLASLTIEDVHGTAYTPFADDSVRAVVLLFISKDCPIANIYQPNMGRIVADYTDRGIAFFAVHADPFADDEEVIAHQTAYDVAAPVVIDRPRRFVELTGATITPEAAVLDRSGEVLYRGRIDDMYVSWGTRRPEPTRDDLREALEDVLEDQAVRVPRTEPVGCYIPE